MTKKPSDKRHEKKDMAREFALSRPPSYTLPALQERQGCLLVKVRAQPGASREGVAGVRGDALKIFVTAAPEKGKANAAISRVLAEFLGLRGSRVQLHSGESSRDKWYRLEGLTLHEAQKIFSVQAFK